MEPNLTCPTCKQPTQLVWNFCPNCGTTLRKKPLSTSFSKQLFIYLLSFFIPVLGFRYAFQYLKQEDKKSRIIGIITFLVTVISIGITIITLKNFMDYYSKILNDISAGRYP